ncbi:hypothetical protein JB92DRAFT_1690851 [Gautieria morchelliformis]|nr:hypothetical protein JB92DRAFT_1690851 [Gautieria morchelliformis]
MERDKHGLGERVLGCWWAPCASLVELPDLALNVGLCKCSGCNKALYCTNDCQVSDWRVHKRQCAVWKAAIMAR